MMDHYYYQGPSPAAYVAHYRRGVQRGKGNGSYGQIFSGARFPARQHGQGIGSFLSGIVRGISNLISRTPSWVKTGAKIGAESALRGLADYGDEVRAGASPQEARKRAFRSALGKALEKGGQKLRGEGHGRRKKKRKTKSSNKGRGMVAARKKKCCRVRRSAVVAGRGRKLRKKQQIHGRKRQNLLAKSKRLRSSIKGWSKFDLLSL